MKDAGFYAHLKSNEMIENSKLYFYNLGAIKIPDPWLTLSVIIQLNNPCSLAEGIPVSIFLVFVLLFDS